MSRGASMKKILGLSPVTFRFMIVAAILVSIPVIVNTYFHINDLLRYKKHIFENLAETLTKNIDIELQKKGIIRDDVALQSFVEEVKFNNQDIHRINVYSLRKGKYVVIASSLLARIGSEADPDDILPLKTRQINIIEKTVDKIPFLEVQAPLYEDGVPVATVGLYLNVNLLKKELYSAILLDTLVIFVVFLVSMFVIYLYFRRVMIVPLLSLQSAVHEVAEGNFKIKAPIYHPDELGEITAAFNRMTEELRVAQTKLLGLERIKAITQVAGAAAHELNQPLTTIYINSELLLRSLPEDDLHRGQLLTIMDQAERMAKIIKMMSEITDYQTKPYLGDIDIIDLEKAREKKE